ncbi:cathepsin D-like isoform X2 [Planococcus citri]|uniref:cathepsin D-like isoform X2 n=1 Tax=Planococcus citri TaxID=170843 RepID=UPI0031F7B04E
MASDYHYQYTNMKRITNIKTLTLQYYGTISIGSPPQKINVLFSLEYHVIQVLSSYCHSSACRDKKHSTYNHTISETFRSKDDFDKEIAKDSAEVEVTDTITIGGIQIHNASFLVSTVLKKECDRKPCDGIMGLGRYSSLLEHCKQFGLKKKFSFYTNYPWDNNTSELMLCGEDKTKFRGNLQYVTSKDYWSSGYEVQRTSVLLHRNDKSDLLIKASIVRVVLNPGASYIRGPQRQIDEIYTTLSATTSKISNLKKVDCKTIHTLPSITFTTAGRKFTLTANDYIKPLTHNDQRVCIVRFMPYDNYYDWWIIGNVFTRKFYTVFDWETNEIGFAESIHGPAQIMIFLF